MVKVDMAKAYDRVDWRFLIQVLKAFGFSDIFCSLINQCVPTSWFSIMMNSTMQGFLKPRMDFSKGSSFPYLFIIMKDVSTRLLKCGFESGCIGRLSHSLGAPLVSHLMYTDDLAVFANSSMNSLNILVNIWSHVNDRRDNELVKKYAIYFSKNCTLAKIGYIFKETEF